MPTATISFEWRCLDLPERKMYDLGALLKDHLCKALRDGRNSVAKTIRALALDACGRGQILIPLFVGRNGCPTEWNASVYYLPKKMSKWRVAAVRIAAALDKGAIAYQMHDVGQMFANGDGVVRDYALALYWECRAKRLGSAKAPHEILRLKNLMDPRRLEKSSALCLKYTREVDEIILAAEEKRRSSDESWNDMYAMSSACECDLHDGKLTRRDFSALEKCWGRAADSLDKIYNESRP